MSPGSGVFCSLACDVDGSVLPFVVSERDGETRAEIAVETASEGDDEHGIDDDAHEDCDSGAVVSDTDDEEGTAADGVVEPELVVGAVAFVFVFVVAGAVGRRGGRE
jgi:hypothetical protein